MGFISCKWSCYLEVPEFAYLYPPNFTPGPISSIHRLIANLCFRLILSITIDSKESCDYVKSIEMTSSTSR